jgi:DNA-binding IclR family transcriptional regulator
MGRKPSLVKKPRQPRAKRPQTRGNSTIIIGAGLLGVVSDFNGPATLTKIAERASMSPSRAYRYLRGLVDCELVEQNPISGQYDLGPEVLRLGLSAISRIDPVRLAIAELPGLSEKTGLVSTIVIWGNHGPTVIRCEHGNLTSPIRVREGIVLPLLNSAAGSLNLAYQPAGMTEPLLKTEIREWNAVNKGKDAMTQERLEKLKEEVRKRGVTRTVGERNPFHANISAPVFGRDGKVELAITLIGVRGSYDMSYTGEIARILKQATQDMTRRLGAVSPTDA